MNRKKRVLAVSAAAVLVLVLAAGWTVLAGDDWPPEVYQVSSPTGTWTVTSPQFALGRFGIASYGAEDLRTGRLSGVVELPGDDPTLDGLAPDGESVSPQYVTFVRTGGDTFQKTGIWYIVGSAEPKVPAWILVLNVAARFTDPDTYEWEGTLSIYSAVAHPGHQLGHLPDQDMDNDGLPDEGQPPILCMPMNGVCHRVGLLPPCEATAIPGPPQQ
jgi:hypothetical protein